MRSISSPFARMCENPFWPRPQFTTSSAANGGRRGNVTGGRSAATWSCRTTCISSARNNPKALATNCRGSLAHGRNGRRRGRGESQLNRVRCGRQNSSITCCGRTNPMAKNGHTFGRIRCGRVWFQRGRRGLIRGSWILIFREEPRHIGPAGVNAPGCSGCGLVVAGHGGPGGGWFGSRGHRPRLQNSRIGWFGCSRARWARRLLVRKAGVIAPGYRTAGSGAPGCSRLADGQPE